MQSGVTANESSRCSISRRQQGVLISLLGIIWVSPDALLVRLAEIEHGYKGCCVFYKYCFKLVATFFGMVFVAYGGPQGYLKQVRAAGWHFYAAAILEGICEASFTMATTSTSAANNLVLVSANPLWCAVLGAVCFKEVPRLHTCVALVLGFCCVVLVFLGSGATTPSGRESIEGDLLGVATGIILALYLTVIRHAGKLRPEATLVPASVLASAVSVVLGLAITGGEVGEQCGTKSGFSGWVYSAVNGMIVMPISLACFAIGPKYIMSAEVGLIMLLEVLLGPLFVWMGTQEVPAFWTFLGGGILIVVLAGNELLSLRAEQAEAAKAAPDADVGQSEDNKADADASTSAAPDADVGQSEDDKTHADTSTIFHL